MGILTHLLKDNAPEIEETRSFEDLSPEEQADVLAAEKAERIKFHRTQVRNGPHKFRTASTGQQRRFAARAQATLNRKVNKNHRRKFLLKQRAVSVLRGQLQAVGVIGYTNPDVQATTASKIAASRWLVSKFGRRDDEGQIILDDMTLPDAINAALAELNRLLGRDVQAGKRAAEFKALVDSAHE